MGHVQHIDAEGIKLPSVSEIPAIFHKDMSGFQSWICKNLHAKEEKCCAAAAESYYKEAANLGNDIHELREAFLNGSPFSDGVPEYQAKVFDPVAAFYKSSGYKPLGVELKMTGKEFGGTLDGYGTFSKPFWEEQRKTFWDNSNSKYYEGETLGKEIVPTTSSIWVEDLKIKSKLDKLHPLQLYGYSLLLKELHGVQADWGLIIRREKKLDKRPELQLKAYYLPAYKDIWDSAMKCWRFLND